MTRLGERAFWVVVLTGTAWLLVVAPAGAYIDPGSTTFIFQAVVAFLAAAGMTVRVYWRRITGLFRRGSQAAPEAPADRVPAGTAGRSDEP